MTKLSYQEVRTSLLQELQELADIPLDITTEVTVLLHDLEDATGIDTSDEAVLTFVTNIIWDTYEEAYAIGFDAGHDEGYDVASQDAEE